jgi:hypothetical protein
LNNHRYSYIFLKVRKWSSKIVILDDARVNSSKRKAPSFLALILLAAGAVFFVQSTLAADISVNAGSSVEFGQGMLKIVACSGESALTLTPDSNFVNGSGGAGDFYFSAITVAGVPNSCSGQDFRIRAFGSSGVNPLALFNSTSTDVVVHNDAGTFRLGAGSRGLSISSGANTFTVAFRVPVAMATSVFKITIESEENTPWFDSYAIGEVGPGGGTVFYYEPSGFNCGAAFSATGSPTGRKCYFLEAAPRGWYVGTPNRSWALPAYELTRVPAPGAIATSIGSGYRNTRAIIDQGNSDPALSAAALAQSYRGGGLSDWYLPSKDELHQIFLNRNLVADNLFSPHWSSSETEGAGNESLAWHQSFSNGTPDIFGKIGNQYLVFPIRAF